MLPQQNLWTMDADGADAIICGKRGERRSIQLRKGGMGTVKSGKVSKPGLGKGSCCMSRGSPQGT
jgi:hypothetical protein